MPEDNEHDAIKRNLQIILDDNALKCSLKWKCNTCKQTHDFIKQCEEVEKHVCKNPAPKAITLAQQKSKIISEIGSHLKGTEYFSDSTKTTQIQILKASLTALEKLCPKNTKSD